MSVCAFGANELGNLARFLVGGASSYERAQFAQACEELALVSRANYRAYRAQYHDGDESQGNTPGEIQRSAPSVTRVDRESALSTARLLQYNTISNDGTEHDTLEESRALAAILTRLVGRLVESPRVEARTCLERIAALAHSDEPRAKDKIGALVAQALVRS